MSSLPDKVTSHNQDNDVNKVFLLGLICLFTLRFIMFSCMYEKCVVKLVTVSFYSCCLIAISKRILLSDTILSFFTTNRVKRFNRSHWPPFVGEKTNKQMMYYETNLLSILITGRIQTSVLI